MNQITRSLVPAVQLPRELIDTIISCLIILSDPDPIYQWTCLRHITRFHKVQVEQHFLAFWVPKLSLTVSEDEYTVQYKARRIDKDDKSGKSRDSSSSNNIMRFEPRAGWQALSGQREDWAELVMRTTYSVGEEERREKRLIVRLGERVLNKGFAQGGIVSDIQVPKLRVDAYGGDLCFDWKMLFTGLFREELAMRRLRDMLLHDFLPTIRATKPETRHTVIHDFLCDHYQTQRREMLIHYRDHITSSQNLTPFSMTPYLKLAKIEYYPSSHSSTYPSIVRVIRKEESMVFHVPGWEHWSVREVARLRVKEEISEQNVFPCEQVDDEAFNRYMDGLKKRWNGMLGTEKVSEEELEKQLKEKMEWGVVSSIR